MIRPSLHHAYMCVSFIQFLPVMHGIPHHPSPMERKDGRKNEEKETRLFLNLYDSSAKLTFKSLKNHERWKDEGFSFGEGWYFQLRNLNPEQKKNLLANSDLRHFHLNRDLGWRGRSSST